jgi:N-methylhydantoinase A/oxoprolinase/acetone carboxylase beta subunit
MTPKPDRLAPLGKVRDAKAARRGARRVYFGPEFMGSGFVDAPVYDGSVLGPGVEVRGPALIEEPFTVVVLPPGATALLDELGNYELTVS